MTNQEIKNLDNQDLILNFEELIEDRANDFDADSKVIDKLRQEIIDRMRHSQNP